jgi:hypothetical protein
MSRLVRVIHFSKQSHNTEGQNCGTSTGFSTIEEPGQSIKGVIWLFNEGTGATFPMKILVRNLKGAPSTLLGIKIDLSDEPENAPD